MKAIGKIESTTLLRSSGCIGTLGWMEDEILLKPQTIS